eukprot:TRINITY_DN11837_c0_g1_i1.p2 TRINITY_DN11837_c0_g1~~TRINITY_DN11837_c0_g1_i1.p2  ORF type:complete len:221 (+),score=19.04 TRINITY_DN11837_c0_g1_i1:591-1253(+)
MQGVVEHFEFGNWHEVNIDPQPLNVTRIVGPESDVSSNMPLSIGGCKIKSLSLKNNVVADPYASGEIQCQSDSLHLDTNLSASSGNVLLQRMRPVMLTLDGEAINISPPLIAPSVKICTLAALRVAVLPDFPRLLRVLPNVCWIQPGYAHAKIPLNCRLCAYFSVCQRPVLLEDSRFFYMKCQRQMAELTYLATALTLQNLHFVDTVAATMLRAVLLISA